MSPKLALFLLDRDQNMMVIFGAPNFNPHIWTGTLTTETEGCPATHSVFLTFRLWKYGNMTSTSEVLS
ncbi:hypothetical protein KFK09_016857 [Dendrobium nobile]|uniref:Uncharacterized protein n=1 Tax=Dendrobium nobile TaxID=94219 RepID=A0A8T3B1T4_DENNO|nr:hypothetical protein KFK09_016857 [Dendrobium nobile]